MGARLSGDLAVAGLTERPLREPPHIRLVAAPKSFATIVAFELAAPDKAKLVAVKWILAITA